jgi:hypothetical protein
MCTDTVPCAGGLSASVTPSSHDAVPSSALSGVITQPYAHLGKGLPVTRLGLVLGRAPQKVKGALAEPGVFGVGDMAARGRTECRSASFRTLDLESP